MLTIRLKEDYIKLGQALKASGLVGLKGAPAYKCQCF